LLRCSDIIKPHFIDVLAAKVREGGVSGSQIFKVAKETLNAKIRNRSQKAVVSYMQYAIMIFKFVLEPKF
jgi:hypothetical protein